MVALWTRTSLTWGPWYRWETYSLFMAQLSFQWKQAFCWWKQTAQINKLSHATLAHISCKTVTDIHQRFQNSYTAPCKAIVSHGAQFGSLWVICRSCTQKQNKTKPMCLIFACHAEFYTYFIFTLGPQGIDISTWRTPGHTAVILNICIKKRPTQLEPHAGIKMAQVLKSLV